MLELQREQPDYDIPQYHKRVAYREAREEQPYERETHKYEKDKRYDHYEMERQ